MNKRNLIAVVAVALMFGASGAWVGINAGRTTDPVTVNAAPGGPQPAVAALFGQTMPDAAGGQQALAQWKGKTLIVNFWAPWCAPCVQEMPELSRLALANAGKNVQVIGIGIDSASNIAEFAGKFKIAYPLYVAGMEGTDLSRLFGNHAGVLPFTALIGADGKLVKTYTGQLKFDALQAELAVLKY